MFFGMLHLHYQSFNENSHHTIYNAAYVLQIAPKRFHLTPKLCCDLCQRTLFVVCCFRVFLLLEFIVII